MKTSLNLYLYLVATALATGVTAPALAACWVISDLQGYSARAADNYAITKDGFSGKVFQVEIGLQGGSVSSSALACKPTSSHSLLCADLTTDKAEIENWIVDPGQGKVFHTKAISGYGGFDGANLFVGKIKELCNK
jgi:hypothetical protein